MCKRSSFSLSLRQQSSSESKELPLALVTGVWWWNRDVIDQSDTLVSVRIWSNGCRMQGCRFGQRSVAGLLQQVGSVGCVWRLIFHLNFLILHPRLVSHVSSYCFYPGLMAHGVVVASNSSTWYIHTRGCNLQKEPQQNVVWLVIFFPQLLLYTITCYRQCYFCDSRVKAHRSVERLNYFGLFGLFCCMYSNNVLNSLRGKSFSLSYRSLWYGLKIIKIIATVMTTVNNM